MSIFGQPPHPMAVKFLLEGLYVELLAGSSRGIRESASLGRFLDFRGELGAVRKYVAQEAFGPAELISALDRLGGSRDGLVRRHADRRAIPGDVRGNGVLAYDALHASVAQPGRLDAIAILHRQEEPSAVLGIIDCEMDLARRGRECAGGTDAVRARHDRAKKYDGAGGCRRNCRRSLSRSHTTSVWR